MLLPARTEVARYLQRYRAWERLMLAAPDNLVVRGNFENTGYTLCVLMGERCAREAADAAEHFLRTGSAAAPHERRTRTGSPARTASGSPARTATGSPARTASNA
ncbi:MULTISPECIES: DUF5133 domain-containing protein [Streptomyces]|nr:MULTISPECIES: DUF5133 domain-containing protein [Streptomyces]MYT02933.1 DUF5133 domain-containing protein [Streptomyces sp. SID5469]OOV26084.1 DUF5133 domain-containing protein [Streptomyces avermitilis]BBJ55751.1 DUF5133 domain-containing protein [Streptomyces avermitilis]GDY67704.1 DUF5133 domain-containing protein [Streptomyces avermitilis]GDY71977.1 DUF5133 domain-containing protein [Streptomyces avermitilis]